MNVRLTMDQAAMQRVAAHGALVLRRDGRRTRIERLYQDGAAKIRMPAVDADPLEAVLINTAGGLTGGDRIRWEIDVGAGASAVVTTQACEKIYRADHGRAEMRSSLRVAAGGHLAWLPQETIVFDRSDFFRQLDVDMADGASALVVEATLFGRLARGETVAAGRFRDRWRVRRDGRLVHGEDFAVGPAIEAGLSRPASASGAAAMATLLLVAADAASRLDEARAMIGEDGGASAWSVAGTGKLLARIVAADGYALRRRLVPLIQMLNGRAGLPKIWSL